MRLYIGVELIPSIADAVQFQVPVMVSLSCGREFDSLMMYPVIRVLFKAKLLGIQ